jgi:hypothetical protein
VRNWRAGWLAVFAVTVLAAPVQAQPRPQRQPPAPQSFDGEAWRRIPVRPGGMIDSAAPPRPAPPRSGRQRCIEIGNVRAAQIYGDSSIELTMKGGQRWRMHLAQECPALSFYQGFYYQQKQAGLMCAGRDAIGARSGGECGIAAIVPVKPERKRRR